MDRFKDRGYKQRYVNGNIIPFAKRKEYLEGSKSDESGGKYINLTTYFNGSNRIKETVKNNWPKLSNDETTRQHILPRNIRFSHKHSKNLSQRLVRAKLNYDIHSDIPTYDIPLMLHKKLPAKNIKCRNSQCGTCEILSLQGGYYSHQRKTYHNIPDVFSCDTKGAIYLLECKLCNKQYIGETGTTMRNRIKHHKNASNAHLNRPIYSHVDGHQRDFDIFALTIIDQQIDLKLRKEKEREYILKLKTKVPFGLNVIH